MTVDGLALGGPAPAGRAAAPARPPRADEVRLLWAASALDPDRDLVAQAASGSDLSYVLEAAAANRVAPLVVRSLDASGVDLGPEERAVARVDGWRARERLAVATASALALDPLNDAGLQPMALKGLALAGRYPDRGLRPMDDIDLLLPRDLASRAADVLEDAGWRPASHVRPDPGYDRAFTHPSAPGVPLELHHEVAAWRERPSELTGARLWASREWSSAYGRPVWGLPPELEIVFLVAHAAKRFHLFGRLLWVVDLAAIARDRPVDWNEVERLAQRSRRRVATAVALTFARRLGVDVPSHMTRVAPVLERSAALMRLLDASRPFDPRSDRALAFVLVDGALPKARLAAADLVSPPRHWSRRQEAAALVRTAARVLPRFARAALPRVPTMAALRIHIRAFVLLVAARLLLPRVGTSATMKRLASRSKRSRTDARHTALAIRRVARTLRLECLHESVALAASLHRDGYAPALVLGCRRAGEGTWTAHAWVELDGNAVEPLGASGHATIARFSARDDWEAGPAEERLADDDR